MTCFISIEGAIAYRPANTANVGRMLAWGSAQDCTDLTATVTTGGVEFQAAGSFAVSGGWVAEIDVANAGLTCGDVADIDLDVTCDPDQSCAAHRKIDVLQCQTDGGCPTWDKFGAVVVDPSDDGCDGVERQVRIEAQLPDNVPPGLGPIFAVIYIRPLEGGAEDLLLAETVAPGELVSAVTALAGGAYTYGVRIVSPAPCEGPVGVIEVPACPVPEPDDTSLCPQITLGSVSVSDHCTPAQQRLVTASATVTPEPGNPVSARLSVMDGDTVVIVLDSATDILDETVLDGTGPVAPGVYTVGVDVTDPAACNFSGQALSVAICGGGNDPDRPDAVDDLVCPKISLDLVEVSGDCDTNGRRNVTATATVTPQPDAATSAALVLMDGDSIVATLDSADDVTDALEMSGSADVAPGDYTLTVRVTVPEDCDSPVETVTVGPCATGGGDDSGGFRIPWCLIALIAALIVLILGAVIFGVAFCVIGFLTNPVTVTIAIVAIAIGLVLLVLGNILFLIWLFTCGSCRLSCGYLNWLQVILASLAAGSAALALVGAVLAWLGLSALCFVGWGIDTINFALLALLVTYWRKVAGCDPWPPGWPRWLRLTLPPALTRLCGP